MSMSSPAVVSCKREAGRASYAPGDETNLIVVTLKINQISRD